MCLVLVSGVGAQEEAIEQLTPIVLDEVLGIDGHISNIAFCNLSDCLVYVDDASHTISIIDISDSFNIKSIMTKSIPSNDDVGHLQTSANDQYVGISTADQSVFVWDIHSNNIFQVPTHLKTEFNNPPVPRWYQRGSTQYLVLQFNFYSSEVWNVQTRQPVPTFDQVIYWVNDYQFVTFTFEGLISVYDATTGTKIREFMAGGKAETVLIDEVYSRIYVSNYADFPYFDITLWDLGTGKFLFKFPPIDNAYNMRLSKDASQVLFWNENTWTLWDTETFSQIPSNIGENFVISNIDWNENETLILTNYQICSSPEECEFGSYIWNATTGQRLSTYTDTAVVWSEWMLNGQWLLAHVSDGYYETRIVIWDASTGKSLYEYDSPGNDQSWALNNAGTKLAAIGNKHAYLWTLPQP
jgi:WD40 repeat protein